MVFQDYLLFANLTALENVAFGLRARGVAKAERPPPRRRAGSSGSGLAEPCRAHRPAGAVRRAGPARRPRPRPGHRPARSCCSTSRSPRSTSATRTGVRRDLRRHLDDVRRDAIVVTHDPVDAYALADRVADRRRRARSSRSARSPTSPPTPGRATSPTWSARTWSPASIAGGVLTTPSGAHVVVAGADAGPSFAVDPPAGRSPCSATPITTRACATRGPVRSPTIDLLGDRARVGIAGALPLTAEITAAALAELALRPGDPVVATAKATDIIAYPA